MSTLQDAVKIINHRLEFLAGRQPEAGGKQLLKRVLLSSDVELQMLAELESRHEPTVYSYKPGKFVEWLTPDVCDQIRIIYNELGLTNVSGQQAGQSPGQSPVADRSDVGRGEPAPKKLKRDH